MARILLLEDEPLIALMLADWIEEMGHETLGPAHGIEAALDLIAQAPPDVAIIDVNIGLLTSYPVAEELVSRQTPFAFATGDLPGSIDERFAGNSTLSKPYGFDAFTRTVNQLLQQRPVV